MNRDTQHPEDSQAELEKEWGDETSSEEKVGSDVTTSIEHEHEHGTFLKKELEEGEKKVKGKKTKEKKKKKKEKNDSIEDKEVNGETEKHREEEIAHQLAEIYENSDGSMPDMKTFESRKTSTFIRALVIFLFSCLFFGAAAWVGLFILQPQSQFSEADVVLEITGDENVVPGKDVTYRLRYSNTQSVSLNEMILEVRYPEGFTVVTTSRASADEKMNTWDLGTLEPGGAGYIDVTGKFFGDSGSKQSIRAFLSYKPSNFTSVFQKVATKTIEAKESLAAIDITVAEKAPRGSKTPITITITPEDGDVLENIEVRCVAANFSESGKSTPESDQGKPCVWSFDTLSEKTVIELAGIFSSPSSTADFGVEIVGWSGENKEGQMYTLAHAEKIVGMVESETNISLVINGGAGDTTIAPGETISASIVVQNKGDVPLTDVVIEAVIDGPSYSGRSILGWQDLKLTGDADVGGEQLTPDTRRGKVIWSKKYVSELASIAPGKQVQVDVSIPIRSGDQVTLGNFTTNNVVFTTGFSYGAATDRKTIASNQINLALVSDFALDINHELTPQSGAAGNYAVSWKLTNSFHPLKNVVLEADFYGDVEITTTTASVGGGELTYDPKNKRITWKIADMPTSVDVLDLKFNALLKIDNPTQKELMSKVRMSAEDDTSHVTIKKVADGIPLR